MFVSINTLVTTALVKLSYMLKNLVNPSYFNCVQRCVRSLCPGV